MLQEPDEILEQIQSIPHLNQIFGSWAKEHQQEFLDFCSGAKGVKVLFDGFFKEVMNPELTPEHLEDFLSHLLHQKVKIIKVLPNDSTRIADESALLITDIVVELENGSIVNVEIQKIGYHFPGERSACYSADLLLRQYKRVRGEKNKKFTYKDIKTVYTIVLFEKSPSEFHSFPNHYLHYFEQCSDTGLKLDLLQKYIFITLDLFRENQHNKIITSKLDAWLMFFSTDDPEEILQLIDAYPEFRKLYDIIYNICRNVEMCMGIFSKELRQLDRNTVQYMMDEMQEQINQQKETIDQQQGTIDQQKADLADALERIRELEAQLHK